MKHTDTQYINTMCVGFFSYSIYLFHVFFTASSRILFNKINVDNIYLVFVFSFSSGLLGPIIAEMFFSKNRYSSLWFLGKKVKKLKPYHFDIAQLNCHPHRRQTFWWKDQRYEKMAVKNDLCSFFILFDHFVTVDFWRIFYFISW